MTLSDSDRAFVDGHPAAAMITTAADGTPRVARCAVAFVDGNLWSSGTRDRVRTTRIRRDPRCTLYLPDAGWSWLALETTATILDGPEAPEMSLRLFRKMQGSASGPLSWFGRQLEEDEFLRAMADEGRVIYQFEIHRAYGLR